MFDANAAIEARVCVIQYRNKNASTLAMFEEACALKGLCSSALFIVNDRIDIALAVNADGVHLGQDDMPFVEARRLMGRKRVIGVTVHTLEEAMDAEHAGADYVGASPIFTTSTKPDAGNAAGIALVEAMASAIRIPIVAIGGITLANAAEVVRAGAGAVCAISAVVASGDPREEMSKFQEVFE